MRPSLSVDHGPPSRRRKEAPALSSPPKPRLPSSRPGDEPLEADGDLDHAPAQVGGHAVDDRARDERLAHGRVRRPVARAAEEVADAHGQVVVGVQQAGARRDDPVAVGVGVVGEGDVELAGQVAQPGHRVGRRAVHADLAVPVARDEAEGRVDLVVGDGQVQAVALGDGGPVGDARAAERVDAQAQAAVADHGEVDDGGQVVDVGRDVVAAVDAVAVRRALDVAQLVLQQRVGLALHPARDVGVGRPAVRRVVLHAAVLGRVVRGGDDDAVGLARAARRGCGSGSRARPPAWACSRRRRRPSRRRRGRRAPPRCSAPPAPESACVSRPRKSGPSMPCSWR